MKSGSQNEEILRFDAYELNVRAGELYKNGRKIRLQVLPLRILAILLELRGQVVTRDELRERLWSPDTFVDFGHSLNTAIRKLRRALNDEAEKPRFIETLPRRGYRFVGSAAENLPALRSRKPFDSIAVLPFENASADPDTEYLSDGITESIIGNLSHLPTLRVMARSTVFRYKGQLADPQKVGNELNVRTVLTGRVVQRGDSLTIGTELVDVANGWRLWGEQYRGKLADLLAVQEEIADEISKTLRLSLTGEERKRLSKRPTRDAQAYQDYLRGRFYWNKRTADGVKKSIEYFEKAIEKDPGYPLAYAGLADSYNILGFYAYAAPRDAYPKAKAAALRALEIDEALTEAQASLADVKLHYDWDWSGAEKEFNRVVKRNPAYAIGHLIYGDLLIAMGRRRWGWMVLLLRAPVR